MHFIRSSLFLLFRTGSPSFYVVHVYLSLKAGIHMNRSKIWSNIKRELLGLKWVGNTTRQFTPKREPKVGSGLFWRPSTNSSLQISIFQFHQIFNISYFPQLTYPLRKNIFFPKCPKITQKFTQNSQTVVNKVSRRIKRCLKHDGDIGRKALLSDVKTAFTCK